MKIRALLLCILLPALHCRLQAQNILSYGNSNVSKQEFLRAFLKNNTDKHPPVKAYKDYLDLYIRFKLKVKAAYDLKMDTLPNQKAELNDFRTQIEETYINDEASFQNLVQEAFLRSQKDIHLAHIFIAIDSAGGATALTPGTKDTTRAWKLAMTVYNALEKGKDFGELASSNSSDASAKINRGDVGYVTLFTLPYALENLAYSLPVGKFSKPFRSKVGYHIFKNLGERKAAGKMKAAQIVFTFPPDTNNGQKAVIKQKADSVYMALMQGAPFNEMVDSFSNDIDAMTTHGEIPEFGVGSFDPRFETAVFALDKNGALTRPILTPVGYYIVKRLDQYPVNTDPRNDSAMNELKQLVRNDVRMDIAKKPLIQKMYKTTGFKKSPVAENALLSYAENIITDKDVSSSSISAKTLLFTFPRQKVYAEDFIKYVQNGKEIQDVKIDPNSLRQFEESMVIAYYRSHLEEYNSDFAAQVKEFKEGNLLFEIMQRNVWDKAAADSSGLKNFYEQNKSKYWWEASADAIIFSCSDSTTTYNLQMKLGKNINEWRNLIPPNETKVQADSGRFELSQLPLQQQMPTPGKLTEPVKLKGDINTSFVYIIKTYPAKQPRSFEDAKGFVLNDYQTYLEEKWMISLKKKYPVKIIEPVFQSLTKTP